MKYYKDGNDNLYVDPILANHIGLTEIDAIEFEAIQEPSNEEIITQNSSLAKATRQAVINSNIDVLGVSWQVAKDDRENIKEVIDYAKDNGIPDETTHHWILADNSLRATTRADLQAVINAYVERKQVVFAQYVAWMSGGKDSPFTYTE